MKYKICNTTDKKFVGTVIEKDTQLEILQHVNSIFDAHLTIEKATKNKIIIRDSHRTVVLKKIN